MGSVGLGERGFSKDKVCIVLSVDLRGRVLAVVSDSGPPPTKWVNEVLKEHVRKGSAIVSDLWGPQYVQS